MFQLVFKDTSNRITDFEILVAWKSVNVDLTLTGVERNNSLATPSFLRNLIRIRIGIFLRLPSTKSHLCVFHRPGSLAFLHYNCSRDPRHVHTECKLPVIWLSWCTQARTTANHQRTRGSPFPTDFSCFKRPFRFILHTPLSWKVCESGYTNDPARTIGPPSRLHRTHRIT